MNRVSAGLVVGVLAVVTACGSAACSGGSGNSSAPAEARAPKSAPAGAAVKVDLEKIFPPGKGRDLVLENCQNCHTFAPLVVLQMDKDAWHRNSLDHRERVTTLTDEEFDTLYTYLVTTFPPGHHVPELPKELLESWTTY